MVITYKPGWDLQLDGDLLVIRATVPDAYGPGDTQIVYSQGCDGTPAGIAAVVARLEHHELREWLRIDGELWDAPHAPGVDPDSGTV